jgi:hypothetical protein
MQEAVACIPDDNKPQEAQVATIDHQDGIWSLDRMALDRNTRPKVFINFWTRSKVLINNGFKFLI